MKNSKTAIFLVFVTIIMQNIIVVSAGFNDFNYTFAFGLPLEKNSIKSFLPLCNMIMPTMVFSFITCDMVEQLTCGYGKLLLVRNFSKRRLLNISIGKSLILLFLIITFQIILYSMHHTGLKEISFYMEIQSFFLYCLVNICLVLLEYLMSFCFGVQLGNLISIGYIFIGCCVGYLTDSLVVKILCFPCLMFGILNGAVDGDGSYGMYTVIIICFMAGIYLGNIAVLKRKDIF